MAKIQDIHSMSTRKWFSPAQNQGVHHLVEELKLAHTEKQSL